MIRFLPSLVVLLLAGLPVLAANRTIATFKTSLGNMEWELFDDQKPVTVSNFIKYASSGRFANQFIQRWEPNFVIQAGGYTVGTDLNGNPDFRTVPVFGTITNEFNVGTRYSNTYGTIAMARRDQQTNSATSQWFMNLGDNSGLDAQYGGFTVFGGIRSGTNVLNIFRTPPTQLFRVGLNYTNDFHEWVFMDTLPVARSITEFTQLFTNIIYVDLTFRRDIPTQFSIGIRGDPKVTWDSVAGVTNVVEYSNLTAPLTWNSLTERIGTGEPMSVIDPTRSTQRIYRVKLLY